MAFWKAIGFPVVRADDDEEEEEIEDPQQTLRVSTGLSSDVTAHIFTCQTVYFNVCLPTLGILQK